jgi:hypothetical protein
LILIVFQNEISETQVSVQRTDAKPGHRARDLLVQANNELKATAQAADVARAGGAEQKRR